MSEKKRTRDKKNLKIGYRRGRNPSRKLFKAIHRGGGGYRPRSSSYILHHNFRYKPEPKYKPKPEKPSQPGKVEPWTEPSIKNQPKVVKYEVDTEKMIKELEKGLDDKLLNKVLEKMDKEFEEFETEVMKDKVDIKPENFDVLENADIDSEKGLEPGDEEIAMPRRENAEENSEIVKQEIEPEESESTESKEVKDVGIESVADSESELPEEVLKDMYLEDEAEVLREREAEQDSEPSVDVIEHLENQDLSELEAEIFQPESEPEPLSEIVEPEEEEEQGC